MDSRFALPVDTIVDGSYRIERVVGSGGFGITYEAEDIKLGTTVALKEYYPFDFGDRDRTMSVRPKSDRHKKTFEWGRSSFLQEARTLARFRHSSVVQVTRVFETNSTAYMVMRFEQGQSFEVWLKSLGRPPTQEELDRITTGLLEALQIMHAEKFLHRDIAPDNIIVRADGTPVLLDFGAARRAVAEISRSLTGIVKAGYSPHEQYSVDGRLQGPWSDIYALGGTLYRAVTGRTPEEATLRVDVDHMPPATVAAIGTYRSGFLSAIDSCLKVRHAARPQSVAELRPMLAGHSAQPVRELEHPAQTAKAPSKPTTRRIVPNQPLSSRWLAIAAAIAVVFGGAYGGYEYTRWQPVGLSMRDAEAKQLGSLIEVRRKEAADAAQRQVELEAAQRRREAADAARRQAELDAERQRTEAAAVLRETDIERERQRKAAVDAGRQQPELDAERQRKEEMERIAVADEATRKAAAESAAKRTEEERGRIASREETKPADEARRKAEAEVKSALDRAALTRSLQTALNRVGCYRGQVDGQWGMQGRAALGQFAKITKLNLATDEPSPAALEAVVARTDRVCPLECDEDKVESDGKCVSKPHKTKNMDASRGEGKKPSAEVSGRGKPQPAERAAKTVGTGGGGSCGYGFWRPGQTCQNKAGQTCTITNVAGGIANKTCQ